MVLFFTLWRAIPAYPCCPRASIRTAAMAGPGDSKPGGKRKAKEVTITSHNNNITYIADFCGKECCVGNLVAFPWWIPFFFLLPAFFFLLPDYQAMYVPAPLRVTDCGFAWCKQVAKVGCLHPHLRLVCFCGRPG